MKDIWTLYKFLTDYYKKNKNNAERRIMIDTISNMGIANYTIGSLKKLLQQQEEIDIENITEEEIISFLKSSDNITTIQIKNSETRRMAPRGTSGVRKYNGLDYKN